MHHINVLCARRHVFIYIHVCVFVCMHACMYVCMHVINKWVGNKTSMRFQWRICYIFKAASNSSADSCIPKFCFNASRKAVGFNSFASKERVIGPMNTSGL